MLGLMQDWPLLLHRIIDHASEIGWGIATFIAGSFAGWVWSHLHA
jgi:hypothetical protein